jgi:hypothetical protein
MKLLTVALLTVMVLGILANITTFSNAQTGIQVNGILSQNTAWTKANSPYTLTDDILVNDEVTLTIEAGATIILNSYYIRVNGSLIVEAGVTINMPSIEGSIQVNGILQLKGTSNNPIQINGINSWQYWAPTYSSIVFSKTSVNYTSKQAQDV